MRTASPTRRLAARAVLLAMLSVSLAGCFYPPPGGGFCYYHPYRCR